MNVKRIKRKTELIMFIKLPCKASRKEHKYKFCIGIEKKSNYSVINNSSGYLKKLS